MRPPSVRLTLRTVSRRDVLAGVGATAALASCDRLDVPEGTDTGLPEPGDVWPPITANDDFYVTSCCGTPEIDRAAWTLTGRFLKGLMAYRAAASRGIVRMDSTT